MRTTGQFPGTRLNGSPRVDGRAVDCSGLENRRRCKPSGGSTPSLPATIRPALLRAFKPEMPDNPRRVSVRGVIDAVADRHHREIERAHPIEAGGIDPEFARVRAPLMMGIDAADRAEIMPGRAGIE